MKNMKELTIAAVLIFVSLAMFKSHFSRPAAVEVSDDQGPFKVAEQVFNDRKGLIRQNKNLKDLGYAYTGNWQKNAAYNPAPNNTFAFQNPLNNRNKPVPAKKADKKKDDKKKKIAKKTATKFYAQKSRYQNNATDDSQNNGDNTAGGPTATTPPAGDATAGAVLNQDKKLTAQQYVDLMEQQKSVTQLVDDLKSGKTDANTFYQAITLLFAKTDDESHTLAYQALGSYRTAKSFDMLTTHQAKETSTTVKALAQTQETIYVNISYLSILTTELGGSSDAARIAASSGINQLVTQISAAFAQSASGRTVASQEYINRLKTVLHPTLTNLTTLLQTGGLDSQVTASFSSTRDTLNQFLS